ncbi:MAG: ABC transporter permease subunit [Planctomycetes bacterium]|nr:ABC transporter permease subunit [Planctomycetota bacterium]
MRMFLVGNDAGTIRSYYMTSGKLLAELHTDGNSPIRSLAFAPKSDAVLAGTDVGTWRWPFDPKHADASLSALFGKVWYERYDEPSYEWQSSSADDAFEPKISLVPLVFGTIKATIYSMLIGLPLAILAAIYTSEFLRGRLKSIIKPIVETMASLPSVVLGFLGAVVVAPLVQGNLASVLAVFITVPISILLGAHIVQALPPSLRWRADRYRLGLTFVASMIGLSAVAPFGRFLERVMFAGSVHDWLDGQAGSAVSGWMMLLLPISILVVTLATSLYVTPWLRNAGRKWSAQTAGLAHLAKFVVASIAVVGVAFGLAWLVPGDLRSGVEIGALDISPIEGFDPRNALVVGFMMGFAVIPIMYTIAEDALSSVPSHLRAAALGAGATSWQTAWRVVVPTAMSGLFSASMVGLGRAVGETMIVLMAAGNTALLSMNVFNGFRTLSANIATELPEAVRDSTHYKTLFLAALVLFAMTFVINTIAESVRIRFRRRAFQL